MKHSERLELFERVRARYSVFLLSVLWKLTGDKGRLWVAVDTDLPVRIELEGTSASG